MMRKGLSIVLACCIVRGTEAFTQSNPAGRPSPTTKLDATSRRDTFGSILGTVLLPTVLPETAKAAGISQDEYPYKVSECCCLYVAGSYAFPFGQLHKKQLNTLFSCGWLSRKRSKK